MSTNPFDFAEDSAAEEKVSLLDDPKPEAKAKADPKPEAKKRRTAEEKLKDDLEAAEALLREHGFYVVEATGEGNDTDGNETKGSAPEQGGEPVDFDAIDLSTPLSALSGQVTASVDTNSGAKAVLRVALHNWVGAEPVSLPATDGAASLRDVLDQLEAQARDRA